ncbi:MAG: hypothetical protein F4142_04485 [Nitrospira sp. SB0675_bin_23]|nr:hypothetical protein [Nitrospira sp. SB0675_bin_23]
MSSEASTDATCANSCWTASGAGGKIEGNRIDGETILSEALTPQTARFQLRPYLPPLGHFCNLSFFSLLTYTLSMAPPTDKRMIHSTLTPSFTFDKELNEQSNADGVFVYGDKISPNEPIHFRRNFAIPEDFQHKTFLDYWSDIYSHPDQIESLPLKRNFFLSYLWNIYRVNALFKKAFENLPRVDESKNDDPQRRTA